MPVAITYKTYTHPAHPTADRGRHEFTYSLYPHAGSWSDALVARRGQELNQPLLSFGFCESPGKLPSACSFFSVDGSGVIIDAVKLAEDGGGLVFRLYEANGRAEKATLRCFRAPQAAVLTDLLEKETAPLAVKDGGIELSFRPFEIKTVKVRFEKP